MRQLKRQLGISGHPNYSGNDGTITRFGWKAQNKSLGVFSGEAYNVEMGVTNENLPGRAGGRSGVVPVQLPRQRTTPITTLLVGDQIPSDVVGFSDFMRFLAPPTPSTQGIRQTFARRVDPKRRAENVYAGPLRHAPQDDPWTHQLSS